MSASDRSTAGPRVTGEGAIALGPVLFFVAVWLGGSSLVLGGLLHPILPGGWFSVVGFLALAAMPVVLLARGLSGAMYPSAAIRLYVFRPFWYAMAIMPLLAIAALLGSVVGFPFGASRGIGYGIVGLTGAAIAVAVVAGFAGSRELVVRQLTVRLPDLPESFRALRVVQISDLHIGPQTRADHLERVAAAVRDAGPDLLVVTGDQVDDFPDDIERFVRVFGHLRPPLGVFAVPGNHDVYAGWHAVRRAMETAGITVLVNEAVPMERNGERFWLAGTGDPAGMGWHRGGGADAAPDIRRTLERVPSGEVVVALAHNPALWPLLAARGVHLTLSGHTHYGQLAMPERNWNLAGMFVHPSMGIHREGASLLYISPGTNYWGIPFRLGTASEVTVITLEPCPSGKMPMIRDASPGGG